MTDDSASRSQPRPWRLLGLLVLLIACLALLALGPAKGQEMPSNTCLRLEETQTARVFSNICSIPIRLNAVYISGQKCRAGARIAETIPAAGKLHIPLGCRVNFNSCGPAFAAGGTCEQRRA